MDTVDLVSEYGCFNTVHCFRVKLSHIEHVFVTHGSWANIGGLTGELVISCVMVDVRD